MQMFPIDIDSISSFVGSGSDPFLSDSLSSPAKEKPKKGEILCKIAFEIEGEEEELLIYENNTLDMVTDELILKLNFASMVTNEQELEIGEEERAALKEEIKAKIVIIMESCVEKNAKIVKWKAKLREFLQGKTQLENHKGKSAKIVSNSKKVKYFAYNKSRTDYQEDESADVKNIEIIQRSKLIESSLNSEEKRGQQGMFNKNRLYELGRRRDAIKEYLSKIREDYVQQEQLIECTFQPNLSKFHTKTEQSNHTTSKFTQKDAQDSVFNRLYKEALNKQEKMKMIQRELSERKEQQVRGLNFIPSINSCSREIVMMKKQISKSSTTSVYEHLYNEMSNKSKNVLRKDNYNFHPVICQKSKEIVQKVERNKKNQLFLEEKIKEGSLHSKIVSGTQTNRANSKGTVRKEKSSSFFQQFTKLYKMDSLSPLKHTKKGLSPLKDTKNVLRQLKNAHSQNRSFKGGSNKKSQQKKGNKRVETCESDHFMSKQQSGFRTYKNVIDISAFGNKFQEDGTNFKKTKENVFFFSGEIAPSEENMLSHGTTQRVSKQIGRVSPSSSPSCSKPKVKKAALNPYDFFQMEESKVKPESNRSQLQPTSKKKLLDTAEENLQLRKGELFERIYACLNTKNAGEINCDSIYESKIVPANLSNVFLPMAEEMKQLGVGLDQEQFVWSLTRIFDSLSPQLGRQLLRWSAGLSCFGRRQPLKVICN